MSTYGVVYGTPSQVSSTINTSVWGASTSSSAYINQTNGTGYGTLNVNSTTTPIINFTGVGSSGVQGILAWKDSNYATKAQIYTTGIASTLIIDVSGGLSNGVVFSQAGTTKVAFDTSGNITAQGGIALLGNCNIGTGSTFSVNGVAILSASALGSGVTASSLTSLGTIVNPRSSGTSVQTGNSIVSGTLDASGGLIISGASVLSSNTLGTGIVNSSLANTSSTSFKVGSYYSVGNASSNVKICSGTISGINSTNPTGAFLFGITFSSNPSVTIALDNGGYNSWRLYNNSTTQISWAISGSVTCSLYWIAVGV